VGWDSGGERRGGGGGEDRFPGHPLKGEKKKKEKIEVSQTAVN